MSERGRSTKILQNVQEVYINMRKLSIIEKVFPITTSAFLPFRERSRSIRQFS